MAESPEKQENTEEIEALSASEAGKVVDAIDQHRTKIIAAIVLVAVAICGYAVYTQLSKQKHITASQAFTAAADKREIAALDAVVVDYPGSIPAGNALLVKAEVQIDQGKSEDARKTLETFLSDYASHPRHAQGLFDLANLYHVGGDAEKAKEYYNKSIEAQADGEITPLARIRLGDLALEAGDKDQAQQYYEESYTIHPGNPFFQYAEEKIALIKVGNPPVVKQPEPEPQPKPEANQPGPGKPKAPAAGKAKAPAKGKAKEAPKAKADAPKPAPKTQPKADAPKPAPKAQPKADTPKPAPKAQPKADTPKPAPAPAPSDSAKPAPAQQ